MSSVNCFPSPKTVWAVGLQPGTAIIVKMHGPLNTGAVHDCPIDSLQLFYDKGAFTTPIVQKKRPRVREVEGLAHNYVDLGHGGRAGFWIQASLPVELVQSGKTRDRMT